MESVSIRVLRNNPGEFEAILARERTVIVNRNARPLAIAIDVTGAPLVEVVRLVTQLRAQLAVAKMRSEAQARGLDQMTPDEVHAAVQDAREARRE